MPINLNEPCREKSGYAYQNGDCLRCYAASGESCNDSGREPIGAKPVK